MNSALKPVLASAGVPQPGGQSSPAKGNVASVNHASVGHPQGAQNSLNHATNSNNLAVQNLTQHVPAPQVPPHAVPSMAPVSANMAQMAQNMSNHGNLSHVNQNSNASPPAPVVVASPSKAPSTSAPLSLVAEKANPSQPLALTRTLEKPEKKEPDSTGQANGSVDSPKSATNIPVTLKAQNLEANKDKIDIAKTSPSTTKPPEKPSTPSIPQKPETASPAPVASQPEVLPQPKVAAASEPSDKSPSKPAEPKPAPTADVAPTQSDSKPVPESANSEPSPLEKDKASTPAKQDLPAETAKPGPAKSEEKKEAEKPSTEEKSKESVVKEKPELPNKEDIVDAPVKVVEKEKVELKKVEPKKEPKPRSTLKLATVTPPLRKRRQVSPVKSSDGPSPAKKAAEGDSTPSDARTKRNRTKVQLYQSPTPELAMATKLSASAGRSTPTKPNDDKLIVFYKNEYLAVRNAEGGFYVCQAMQNVYRSTRKIKIRWLSQDKKADPSGETYKPDFYDVTDMECVLTTLSLARGGGGAQLLREAESARAASILQRALRAETSPNVLQLTPEHPDGLDLSLFTDESQLEKRARKRAASKSSPSNKDSATDTVKEETTPVKKARTTPKRSPKSSRKAKATPPPPPPPPAVKTNNNKRKSTGSTPIVPAAKTATAVVEKAKAGRSAPKRTPPKPRAEPVTTPQRKGRRSAAKEAKPSPALEQPSTSTGKTTGRTSTRKAPARK